MNECEPYIIYELIPAGLAHCSAPWGLARHPWTEPYHGTSTHTPTTPPHSPSRTGALLSASGPCSAPMDSALPWHLDPHAPHTPTLPQQDWRIAQRLGALLSAHGQCPTMAP